jgi:SagB-type dehydrogenase family enzyme
MGERSSPAHDVTHTTTGWQRAPLDEDEVAGAYVNAFKPLHVWVESTAFRTHGFRYTSLDRASYPRVAEEFLLNTQYVREDRETEVSIEAYFAGPYTTILAELDHENTAGLEEIALPEGVHLRLGLGEALSRRASGRIYTGDPIELTYLAAIIRSGAAVTREARVESVTGERTLRFRAAPSGGGLYPVDVYIVAADVTALSRGVYRYLPRRDTLVRVGGDDVAAGVFASFNVREEIITLARANALVLLVGRPWRSMRKYGPRGLRYLLLEAGAILQNVHLATQALGYASVDCASVVDAEVHEALGLDGISQAFLHAIVIGYAG